MRRIMSLCVSSFGFVCRDWIWICKKLIAKEKHVRTPATQSHGSNTVHVWFETWWRWTAEIQTENRKGRWFLWLWMWHSCWCQTRTMRFTEDSAKKKKRVPVSSTYLGQNWCQSTGWNMCHWKLSLNYFITFSMTQPLPHLSVYEEESLICLSYSKVLSKTTKSKESRVQLTLETDMKWISVNLSLISLPWMTS